MRVLLLLTMSALAVPAGALAAPIVLYDQTGKALPQPACGDLTKPCDTLTTTTTSTTSTAPAAPPVTSPLPAGVEVGATGYVSGAVSNHGSGESAGVLGWLRDGDTTVAVGISGNLLNGGRYYAVPAGVRP